MDLTLPKKLSPGNWFGKRADADCPQVLIKKNHGSCLMKKLSKQPAAEISLHIMDIYILIILGQSLKTFTI